MSNKQPIVTIGLPFYNIGTLIFDAIRSIYAQTYSNWELIMIDDGSQDGTCQMLSEIRDPRVSLIRDGRNLGISMRLNQIIALARGDFIARMDADDLMHPRRLETQVAYLLDHPCIDVVDTGAVILDTGRSPVGMRGLDGDQLPTYYEMLKRGGILLHASILARKDWYRAHLYNSSYRRAEDRDLFLRALAEGKIAHLPEPLYYYMYEGNLRLSKFLQSYASERKLLRKHGPRLIGIPAAGYLYLRSLAKSLALIALVRLRLETKITKRAYQSIPPRLAEETKVVLSRIRRTSLPGI